MRHRHIARRLTTTGLLATGLIAPGLAAVGTPAVAAAPHGAEGSAYGLTASGPVAVPPVPAVSSTTETVRKSLVREDRTKLVKASALDVSASSARARSSVTDLSVPAAKLLAGAVTARCDGGRGSAHLARAVIAGKRLDASPPPNTTVPVDVEGLGRASLVLNKQQRMSDGRLAVTAMELNLPLPGKPATVRAASATCGKAGGPSERPSDAPAPTPVEHDLPVTG
ncbi:choice-of-anchor P family protein [Actinomadura sp. 7K507]|uniref:choice-of-anchor P family protein n=1 Tax=Actinomadura sp. 7K507 TaxID=2530365 RepID=UPI001404E927|nr:choice-of-anchor P family protein [Actinomadura sp. 7K507]